MAESSSQYSTFEARRVPHDWAEWLVRPSGFEDLSDPGRQQEPGPSADAPMPMTGIALGEDRGNPLRRFIRTETASAGIVLGAVLVAVVWANLSRGGYVGFWESPVAVRLGSWSGAVTFRDVVNEGLMTVFFLVVGLEARREVDLGELRDRRRTALAFLLGVAGMLVPIGIYLAVTHGSTGASGWGLRCLPTPPCRWAR
jgi:Na+/H+ antiporter 1